MKTRVSKVLPVTLLTVALGLTGCGTATPHHDATAAVTSAAPVKVLLSGQAGRAAWRVTAEGLYVSSDLGRQFTSVRLPAKVSPHAIVAVSHTADGPTWLCTTGPAPSIIAYRFDPDTGRWSWGAQLEPRYPPGLGAGASPPSSVVITSGTGSQVVVTTHLLLTHAVALTRIFVSRDGGHTYAQRVLPATSDLNTQWWSMTMPTSDGVAVIGDRANHVVYSADSGSRWSASRLSGVSGTYVVGSPVFVGPAVYLPVTENISGHSSSVLLRSADRGVSFAPLTSRLVTSKTVFDPAPPVIAYAKGTWWMVQSNDRSVYRSTNNGRSWSKAGTVPTGVVSIGAADGKNASVTIQRNECVGGASDCTSEQFLITTSDAGASWHEIS